jgi:hypothetical protein
MNPALRILGRSLALTAGHRAAIALYMLFALFPLFWLIKIAVTPERRYGRPARSPQEAV